MTNPRSRLLDATALTLGFAFLYLPIVILVVFSFNASQLVTVWGGFSTRWYSAIWQNRQLMDAAWMTVKVAAASAAFATVVGTLAALALNRYLRFRGRFRVSGLV